MLRIRLKITIGEWGINAFDCILFHKNHNPYFYLYVSTRHIGQTRYQRITKGTKVIAVIKRMQSRDKD